MDKGLNNIFNKVTGRKRDSEALQLANLLREFGCVADLLGRDFEVYDAGDRLLYKVRQKSITIGQMNSLLRILHDLQEYENDQVKRSGKGRK